MALTKLSLAGNNLVFPARESLVSDIPAGDGNNDTFFYSVVQFCKCRIVSFLSGIMPFFLYVSYSTALTPHTVHAVRIYMAGG